MALDYTEPNDSGKGKNRRQTRCNTNSGPCGVYRDRSLDVQVSKRALDC